MKFRLRAGARHAVLLFFLQCLHTRASFRLCCGRGARSAIQPKKRGLTPRFSQGCSVVSAVVQQAEDIVEIAVVIFLHRGGGLHRLRGSNGCTGCAGATAQYRS